MCRFCNYKSDDCEIFIDPLEDEFYLDYETMEWDEHEDGFIHERIYINYCPWCGEKLGNK